MKVILHRQKRKCKFPGVGGDGVFSATIAKRPVWWKETIKGANKGLGYRTCMELKVMVIIGDFILVVKSY